MKLVGSANQGAPHPLYDASGSIAVASTPQLILGQSVSRSSLLLQNTSAETLTFELGSARATATITNGAVTAITVTNAGFGFSKPPIVRFLGGGLQVNNSSFVGLSQPNGPAPSNFAVAHCVMAGTAPNQTVASITIDNPGSGYVIAPYVFIYNSPLDPNGCAAPSATGGIVLSTNGSMLWNGTACPTDAVAVFGGTLGQTFTAKWMD